MRKGLLIKIFFIILIGTLNCTGCDYDYEDYEKEVLSSSSYSLGEKKEILGKMTPDEYNEYYFIDKQQSAYNIGNWAKSCYGKIKLSRLIESTSAYGEKVPKGYKFVKATFEVINKNTITIKYNSAEYVGGYPETKEYNYKLDNDLVLKDTDFASNNPGVEIVDSGTVYTITYSNSAKVGIIYKVPIGLQYLEIKIDKLKLKTPVIFSDNITSQATLKAETKEKQRKEELDAIKNKTIELYEYDGLFD